jgi:hypothetical protein
LKFGLHEDHGIVCCLTDLSPATSTRNREDGQATESANGSPVDCHATSGSSVGDDSKMTLVNDTDDNSTIGSSPDLLLPVSGLDFSFWASGSSQHSCRRSFLPPQLLVAAYEHRCIVRSNGGLEGKTGDFTEGHDQTA